MKHCKTEFINIAALLNYDVKHDCYFIRQISFVTSRCCSKVRGVKAEWATLYRTKEPTEVTKDTGPILQYPCVNNIKPLTFLKKIQTVFCELGTTVINTFNSQARHMWYVQAHSSFRFPYVQRCIIPLHFGAQRELTT